MRYSSVECTRVVPRKARRRFGFLACNKWRLPARERNTLPVAVILKRFATDFFVLMPLGRRIIQSSLFKKNAQYTEARGWKQGVILKELNFGASRDVSENSGKSRLPCVRPRGCPESIRGEKRGVNERAQLSAFSHPGGQTVFPTLGRIPRPGREIIRLRRCAASYTPSRCHEQQKQKPIANSRSFHVSTP